MKNNDEYLNNEHLKYDLKRKAVRGASITVFAKFCNYGIEAVGAVILARILSPEDFGIVAMVTVFSLLLQNFGVNGFTEVIIQKDNLQQKQISNFFWVNIGLSSALMFIFIAGSPFVAMFYNEPRLKNITIMMGLSILFGGLSTHHIALLKRNMNFIRTSIIDICAVSGSVLVGILLAVSGYGYWALVIRRISIPFITAILAWIICRWRPSFPSKGSPIKDMLIFALQTYGNYCFTYFRRNLDKILLGRFHGSEILGSYDRAYHFSSMLPNQLTIPITNVAIATLSRLKDQPEKFKSYYYFIFEIICLIGMLASAVFFVSGKDMILFLLGDQWETAGKLFTALAPSLGMILLYNTQQWLHLSLGRADRLFRWGYISFFVTVIIYLIGLPFGGLGMAIAYSCNFFILLFPAIWFAGKPINLSVAKCIKIIWKYLLSAFFTCICMLVIYRSNLFFVSFLLNCTKIIRILINSLGVTIIYCLIILLLFRGTSPFKNIYRLAKEF